MRVTLVTVVYQPQWERTLTRALANLAALETCHLSGELLVIDNSPVATPNVLEGIRDARYEWNDGYNIYLGGALNQSVSLAKGEVIVYFCASHGLLNDPTWIADIVSPLADPQTGIAGHVHPCNFDRVAAVPEDIIEPQIHVQGGVWAARRDVLADFGFSHRFPFEFCDVDLSRRMLARGFRLASVPTIVSVAGGQIPDPQRYKYVHDYR